MTLFSTLKVMNEQLTQAGAPFELETDNTGLKLYKNAPRTIRDMIQGARKESDDIFLSYQQDDWSYTRFFTGVDTVAAYLQNNGVKKGDRIAIAMRNRPEWAVAFIAAVMIGAVPAPLNSFGLGEEMGQAISDIEATVLICDEDRLVRLQAVEFTLPDLTICLYNQTPNTEYKCFNQILCVTNCAVENVEISERDPALILFTSGATSRAKAAESSNIAVCQALFNINYIAAISGMSSPEIVQSIQAAKRPPVALTAVPLFHVSGLHAQLLNGLLSHRKLIFLHKWDIEEAVTIMERDNVTVFNGAPSMVMQMLRNQKFSHGLIRDQLAGLGFGGAGIPAGVINDVIECMPDKMVGVGYGMTESNGVGSAGSGEIFKAQPSASGLVSPIMQVRTVDENGDVCDPGTVGEIQLKSVALMNGYLDNEHEFKSPIDSEGWLSTGDIGYVSEHNYLYIVDRKKDVINRAGENISAAEVESCLMRHKQVLEAAVIGLPDDELGESVVAIVHRTGNNPSLEKELIDYCRAHLAAYKIPCKVLTTEQKLPRNPAGKILKAALKERFAAEVA